MGYCFVEGMEDYEDGFEAVAVRFREGRIVRRVDIAFVLHVDKDNKAGFRSL